ncbi:MAG: hypothetical protein A3B74_01535 [Candidatus Kerfeldbacteria bacterium RIFCSPHIGHO2_02_FULL_42_14]|uniref:Cell division protein FtsL n=1 Tax=Candidatus Kerfeldbacteria bacterium RIFCSPHIGHO2_02_FULL_42_14 TaxID=1798540 RepID=A0A1G2ATB4_9BACT|nr:MAG: hypothetical protein A3B74_01535 [Candidatus Kerfeldbacteria bacterium RIFCSPHIGHO2_02_FULL_42_14]OGY82300.1 MAG: hypothetical protein A3E60_03735 [Candidatus Kerfeldbacteria bacterium RIFCSPHIGHO2_12_FULL_42_13]OGY84728.1 MAG: hypothetical protein A3I91_05535 [Candidatus Kerfeldbacteria bacterium RIFCSPLOWO2_02_FULL_42_19]OGY85959.1 MAG: hypothetical protein A3G01_03440 [Candidatus Kerfeldbacteria bacterium RIFCSPLOWO2_12_FULL_43_9]
MSLTRPQQRSFFYTFWHSRFFVVCALVFLVFILLSLGKVINRRAQVKNELHVLEAEITQLEQQNTDLERMIAYMNTDARVERESRSKLGLQKPEESVLFVPSQVMPVLTSEPLKTQDNADVSNPRKWWGYFFSVEVI